MNENSHESAIVWVWGKPAKQRFGTLRPAFFGRTTLSLCKTRIVENTRRIVARRYSEILLTEVDSAEMTASGNPVWLFLGLITLPLAVGMLFLVVYFFKKHRFLIIHSGSIAQVVAVRLDVGQYCQFMTAVLKAAEKAKSIRKTETPAPLLASRSAG